MCYITLHRENPLNHAVLARDPPSLIIEEVWLVSLYNDYVKEIPPVLSNDELHTLVPTERTTALTMK